MHDTAIAQIVREKNPWWRSVEAWRATDRYLRELADAPFDHRPQVLADIRLNGLYVLTGPRRVGKSAELRRTIETLIDHGVNPRAVVHCSCDGFRPQDLRRLFSVARNMVRTVEGPLYWLIDEVTSVGPEWSAVIKDLRDDTALRDDCVVLTGSSSRGLRDATKNLAGRRGPVSDSFRLLLPMTFREFSLATGVTGVPTPQPLRPADLRTHATLELLEELQYHVDPLTAAWADYLRIGGYPRALTDFLRHGDVQDDFATDLFDVIRGEVINTTSIGDPTILALLDRLARNLTSPVNLSSIATELGLGSHHTVEARLEDLCLNYVAWRCYRSDSNLRPRLAAQRKLYFLDPLTARLAAHRNPAYIAPDAARLSEQQIGLALARAIESERPLSFAQANGVLHQRTNTNKEVDFVGPELPIPVEVKFGQRHWRQEAKTVEANHREAIMATADIFNTDHRAWAVPAPALAWLLG